ncbi:unnamed protein product, partial [Phaeothamnion confervicola]
KEAVIACLPEGLVGRLRTSSGVSPDGWIDVSPVLAFFGGSVRSSFGSGAVDSFRVRRIDPSEDHNLILCSIPRLRAAAVGPSAADWHKPSMPLLPPCCQSPLL